MMLFSGPKIFHLLFSLVKPFLSVNTVSKISIFDSNESIWKKEIESLIDTNQLPFRYGGTNPNPSLMD
jgi:hypothetical protein